MQHAGQFKTCRTMVLSSLVVLIKAYTKSGLSARAHPNESANRNNPTNNDPIKPYAIAWLML
jgi:hypothetical protein